MQGIIEEFTTYSTAKMVKINDKRLGILSMASTIAILIYICFVMFSDQQYLYRETPVGTVRLSLRAKANASTVLPAYCLGSPTSYTATRLLLPCINFDENSAGFQATALDSIYLPTRVNLSSQALPAGCAVAGTAGCGYIQLSNTAFYTADAEKWTFKIVSAAKAPTLAVQGSSTELKGRIALCRGNDSKQRYRYLAGDNSDIFTLEELLSYACHEDTVASISGASTSISVNNETVTGGTGGARQWMSSDLEQPSDHSVSPPQLPLSPDPTSPTFESVRYAGAIITLSAQFDNTYTYSPGKVGLTYTFRRLPLTEYKAQFTLASSDLKTRTVFSSHGIILITSIQGVFATPRFQEFLINLTSGLGLLAFSTFLVEFIMLRVVKDRKTYDKEKHSSLEQDFEAFRARMLKDLEITRMSHTPSVSAPAPQPQAFPQPVGGAPMPLPQQGYPQPDPRFSMPPLQGYPQPVYGTPMYIPPPQGGYPQQGPARAW